MARNTVQISKASALEQAHLKRLLPFALLLLAATMLLLVSAPAKADSFYFGYSTGWQNSSGHRYRGHDRYRSPPARYRYNYSHWAPPPVYYHRPPPRVVYVEPPPPRVVYMQPPVQYQQAPPVISAVPNSPVYQANNGQYCREYQSTVVVGGVPQPSYGTACLMPDGIWRVVN